jgi:hypothetical protein
MAKPGAKQNRASDLSAADRERLLALGYRR